MKNRNPNQSPKIYIKRLCICVVLQVFTTQSQTPQNEFTFVHIFTTGELWIKAACFRLRRLHVNNPESTPTFDVMPFNFRFDKQTSSLAKSVGPRHQCKHWNLIMCLVQNFIACIDLHVQCKRAIICLFVWCLS